MAKDRDGFLIKGTVEEKETGRPLRDIIIRAYDRDHVLDDKLGFDTTDDEGRFEISFGTEAFRDVWESRPDIYLRIFDTSGARLIHKTRVRWNASHEVGFYLRLPARSLAP